MPFIDDQQCKICKKYTTDHLKNYWVSCNHTCNLWKNGETNHEQFKTIEKTK